MKSNLDVWAIQYYPEELLTAMNQIKDGINIIYSNLTCSFKIGNQEINTRQFDTILYNEESDVLIMLMRGGKATKQDMISFLEKEKKEYGEVVFIPSGESYQDGNDIPELWFAREQYVLEDALKDSINKGITNCEFYVDFPGTLEMGYLTSTNEQMEVDGRIFKGLIKLNDKVILIINQSKNIDKTGKNRNMSSKEILSVINNYGLDCDVFIDEEPDLFVQNTSKKR